MAKAVTYRRLYSWVPLCCTVVIWHLVTHDILERARGMNNQVGLTAEVKLQILRKLQFGARTAEEEADALANYFVQTDQWQRMLRGEIDVVYGAKGAGKSAIYTLLQRKQDELFMKNIITATAENPRGATIFRDIVADPPASEREFITFWKIYILGLLGRKFQELDIENAAARRLIATLISFNLLEPDGGLARLFKNAKELAAKIFQRQVRATSWTVGIDPTTMTPTASRTAEYGNPEQASDNKKFESFSSDDLLQQAAEALSESGFSCWILFDRLDVAFEDSKELERNALRALFRVYNDMRGLSSISMKIFVREDIWRRITESGFAEASHITRTVTIKWDVDSLMNLAVRRLIANECIKNFVEKPDEILRSLALQTQTFYSFFPRQIDTGHNKPLTFEWILGHTKDGTGINTPRELIHFLTEIRNEQIQRFERGGDDLPPDNHLFTRGVFKAALRLVSETRLTQTLLAEYPELRSSVMALKGERTLHYPESLAKLWSVTPEEAHSSAARLVSVGFFELRGTKTAPQYWVPFIYRDALAMVQGTAE